MLGPHYARSQVSCQDDLYLPKIRDFGIANNFAPFMPHHALPAFRSYTQK